MSKGRDRYRGKRRPISGTGVYTTCWQCRGRGWIKGKRGVRLTCTPCAGDGLIRTGTKRKGRGRPPGGRPPGGKPPKRRNGPKGPVRRALWYGSWSLAFIGLGHARGGTIGAIMVTAVIAVAVVLKVLAMTLRGVARMAG